MSEGNICEGVFAVHKPQGISSADVIRDLQRHFNPSKFFAPWLSAEQARRDKENNFQRRRRRNQKLEVKIGHGGTLDPLATGVLVAGVGKGTKRLNDFLGCTKSYETVLVFGAETDTYDKLGKVVRRAPYEHITKEAVEKALDQFRGKIMQRPPIFSALKVKGKPMYVYAREGLELPIEIKERPVEVVDMQMVEWYEPGTHDYKWPEVEAAGEEKAVAEKLLAKDDSLPITSSVEDAKPAEQTEQQDASSTKRKSPPPTDSPKAEETTQEAATTDAESAPAKKQKVSAEGEGVPAQNEESSSAPETAEKPSTSSETNDSTPKPQPAAVKISMTVTSGFYVRSFAHDLGKALGSCGLMSSLVRTRQADFELDPKKVLEYSDLEAGEEVWGPKVQEFLKQWQEKMAAQESK